MHLHGVDRAVSIQGDLAGASITSVLIVNLFHVPFTSGPQPSQSATVGVPAPLAIHHTTPDLAETWPKNRALSSEL